MSEIIAHDAALEFLRRSAAGGRPAHAYLFSGTEGIGKKQAAVKFACMLNCDAAAAGEACSCHICRRIVVEKHPDVTIERPERGAIRIDRIRDIQGRFKYAPVEGRYRVAITDDAHLMNRSAQNALLKTLEEPPPGSALILVSSKPSMLFPTVRSRCRKVRFQPIPLPTLASLLQEKWGAPREKAEALASLSGGSVSRALNMDSSGVLDVRRRVISGLTEPGRNGVRGIFELASKVSADRQTALTCVETACGWIRDVLVAKTLGDTASAVHSDCLDIISAAAQHQSTDALLLAYDEASSAGQLLEAENNFNRNLILDVMLLRITRLLAGPQLGLTPEAAGEKGRYE
jgi:DNA polymerase-3 subunit delta'